MRALRDEYMNIYDRDSAKALKGIGILLMVFHHCFWSRDLFKGYSISFFPLSEQIVINIAGAGKICVAIFAFISGYGFFLNYRNAEKHQCDRLTGKEAKWVLRRYIASFSGYWFVWILSTILTQIIDGRPTKIYFNDGSYRGCIYLILDFFGLAKLFETPSLNTDWWYMSVLIVFIALLPILYKLKNNVLLILVWTVLLLRVIFGHNGEEVFTGWSSVYVLIPIFIMGFLFAYYQVFDRIANICIKEKPVIRIFVFACLCWLLLLMYKLYYNTPISWFWEIHYTLFPLVFIVICIEYIIPLTFVKRILVILGKHSSNIYFVHAFVRTYYLHDLTYSWKYFMMVFIFLMLISLVISFLIEWLKRITKYNLLFKEKIKTM